MESKLSIYLTKAIIASKFLLTVENMAIQGLNLAVLKVADFKSYIYKGLNLKTGLK